MSNLYFSSATKNEFAKIHAVVSAMNDVLDQQYAYVLKNRDKFPKTAIDNVRSAITFLILAERTMTENVKFPLYKQMQLEGARLRYIEESVSKKLENVRYDYMVNMIGRNVIMNNRDQTIGTCLVYQNWYLEDKLKSLDVHLNKHKELISFKIILRCVVRSMKNYFDAWVKTLEGFTEEETFKIERDMDLFEGEELLKFNKIMDAKIDVYFRDADENQKVQRFFTAFSSSEESKKLPFVVLVDEYQNDIKGVFNNLKIIGMLDGVYEPILIPEKGTELAFNIIKAGGTRISLDSKFGDGGYVFSLNDLEVIETKEKDIVEGYIKFIKKSEIYSRRVKAVKEKMRNPRTLTMNGRNVVLAVSEMYHSSKNIVIDRIIAIIEDAELIETNTVDPMVALNYVKNMSVLLTKKGGATE